MLVTVEGMRNAKAQAISFNIKRFSRKDEKFDIVNADKIVITTLPCFQIVTSNLGRFVWIIVDFFPSTQELRAWCVPNHF